ncbi:hypothetical protein D9757_007145 [Collybiopsis confluens]|uniref:Nucleotidylyl transferase n=1 Tax=Collybiopsis confluens TaxID=2823264 RepID=A0A8H5HCI4_9AGAR|nr:hypothetical protein D9757_007145 [Collybiopsis confluens]
MSSIASALNRLRAGTLYPPVELIWSSHPSWPFSNPHTQATTPRRLRISVLDSSFNPPTLAHFALADAPTPALASAEYDAKLLLLSVRNADKQLKPTDATYAQRVEMMVELANDLQDAQSSQNSGLAVAIIDEPTFVGKSRLLQDFFKGRSQRVEGQEQSSSSSCGVQLTFLLGHDTLERLFSSKYYGDSETKMYQALRGFFSPPILESSSDNISRDEKEHGAAALPDTGGDGSVIVCARRNPSSYPNVSLPAPDTAMHESAKSSDDSSLQSLTKAVSEFLKSFSLPSSSITMIDIGEDAWRISSSEIREKVKKVGEGNTREAGVKRPWETMVSRRIQRYIVDHRLYK